MKYILLIFLTTSSWTFAATVPNDFQPNTPASAAEVNANFQALVDAVSTLENQVNNLQESLNGQFAINSSLQNQINDQQINIDNLQSDVSDLETARTTLQNQIAALESNTVLTLDGYLSLEDFNGYDTAVFEGINLQVTSGAGFTTAPVNGLGNLIVGYNGSFVGLEFCSDPSYDNQITCDDFNGTWDANVHTGSHNIILGEGHSYTGYGAMVLGYTNVSNENYASVLGGAENIASGSGSTISGGIRNNVSGYVASISGGSDNTATASYSSVSGGNNNAATQWYSSVNGGQNNTASEFYSSVSGGEGNTASGAWSSVSGGGSNVALGIQATVNGGFSNNATERASSISGGRLNSATAWHTSVSGGVGRVADVADEWVAGSLSEDN